MTNAAEGGYEAADKLNAMSEPARRILRDRTRWWLGEDGHIRLHLTLERDELDLGHEIAEVLCDAFDMPLIEGPPTEHEDTWDITNSMSLSELSAALADRCPR